MTREQKTQVRFPIAAKLVTIISILVLVSLGTLTSLVSMLSTQDVQRTAEDSNFTVNRRAGSQAEGSFRAVQSAALLYLELLEQGGGLERNPALDYYFFGRNRNIAAIAVFLPDAEDPVFILNEQFFLARAVELEEVREYLRANGERFTPSPDGWMRFFNAAPALGQPLLVMAFAHRPEDSGLEDSPEAEDAGDAPDVPEDGLQAVQILFFPDDLSESFGTGTNSSFMINGGGEIVLHPDADLVLGGANFSNMPLVADMQAAGDNNRQVSFTDADGQKYFGAYYRLDRMDTVVLTTIPYDVVFEAVQSITWQNIWLTAGVLFVGILFVWFFSKTISSPVRTLAAAALRIEQGDFEVDLKARTGDELGLLTESFGKMSSALGIFGRFTNKSIAIRAMRGEIKPGGLPKQATIFFSDIRNFTEKSENFTKAFGDDASNRIVHWLNEYFTRMVDCVEKTGGMVDKFIGDAVMAHWGTAFTAGSPGEDALNCVRAALMMRQALMEINGRRSRDNPGDPEIRIGCGINSGVITAGQIGSEQHMEYTVIGTPVNLASRTEALNKPFGTDILITEDTWELVNDKIITEEMPPVTIKGREKPVRMFAVVNLKDAPGPRSLGEVRFLLGIPVPDINKVDADAKEQKYTIQDN
ncbi:MAG: HAMP domain-containing protein [Treponema sp.]|jgi:adenylate cyclase|nr:HAMP domain-containing protein [Treponema sp.]